MSRFEGRLVDNSEIEFYIFNNVPVTDSNLNAAVANVSLQHLPFELSILPPGSTKNLWEVRADLEFEQWVSIKVREDFAADITEYEKGRKKLIREFRVYPGVAYLVSGYSPDTAEEHLAFALFNRRFDEPRLVRQPIDSVIEVLRLFSGRSVADGNPRTL